MGNIASYKVIDIGFIRLKLLDGTIRELHNVRHIPELKRNLIFLSMLVDKVGCVIKMVPSVLRVIKGSLVLMKGDMSNGLYVLQGTALTGDVNVAENQI